MTFFRDIERIIKNLSDGQLPVLEHYYGINLKLYRTDKDKYADVYGKHAGNKADFLKNFIGILVNDDFFADDKGQAGNFTAGFLYTSDLDIRVSDVIEIDSDDDKIRKFVINSKESLGTQNTVVVRYKISNLGN